MGAELEGTEGEGLGSSPLSGPDSGYGDSLSSTDVVQSGRSPLLLLGGLAVVAVVAGLLFFRPQPGDDLAEEESESPAEAEVDPAQTEADPDPAEMLLGEPTNLGLVLANPYVSSRVPTRLLVLDTGELVELGGVTGGASGVVDGRLVVSGGLFDDGSGTYVVDLRQPSLPVEPLAVAEAEAGESDGWGEPAVWGVSEGLVWVVSEPGEPERLVVTASTVDGEVVLTGDLPLVVTGAVAFVDLYLEGRLVQGPDGAIYRDTGSGYERVGFGGLEASTADAVLVAECDRSKDCTGVWRDRQTWELLPYPSVSTEELRFARSVPGGRLELWDLGNRVVDIASGDVVLENPESYNLGQGFSPDGRWVAYSENDETVVLDLATDTTWPISDDGWERPLPASAVWLTLVDLTDTVFAGS